MSLVERKELARLFVDEEINKGKLQAVDKFVTPDLVYHAMGQAVTGIEKFNGEIFI